MADGGFAVTWWGNNDIFVQKFDSNGNRDGSEIQLDGQGGGDWDHQITALTDGGFVVTWQGYNGNNYDIFVQKFDSNGNTAGSEVQFDGQGYDDYSPQIIALTDGGFVVTWQGYDSSHESDIFVQKFNSEGTLVSAQSSEVGTGYLVDSTISVDDVLDITSSADSLWNSVDI
ncbi:MAG: hypothetical protein IE883_08195, partial [Epsilonproteobacteria bacterium]|nr:hypothetical protein [Campylobacterota bacterium]